jgi:predicted DNA-binding protein (UPF0251 family)
LTAANQKTPWQRVYAKFGMSQSAFARALKRHRSKVSRALRDSKGLINGKDQELIIMVAKEYGVDLSPDDITPVISHD